MADWLRPVFQRARTSAPNSPIIDRFSEDSNDTEESAYRRPAPRVSSFLNLRPSTPISIAPESFPNFRAQDTVYQPSGEQMAEALKVVMMTRSTYEPLPVEYNTCILQVLESYYYLKGQMHAKERSIHEVQESHTRSMIEFESLASQWAKREQAYKDNIRHLEHVLSKAEGGMDGVMLTRSKSSVHDSRRGTMGTGVGGHNAKVFGVGQSTRSHRWAMDSSEETVIASPQGTIGRYASKPSISTKPVPSRPRNRLESIDQLSSDSLSMMANYSTEVSSVEGLAPSRSVTDSRLKDLERQESIKKFGVAFESSESGTSTRSDDILFEAMLKSKGEEMLSTSLLCSKYQKATLEDQLKPIAAPARSNRASRSPIEGPKSKRFSFQIGDEKDFDPSSKSKDRMKPVTSLVQGTQTKRPPAVKKTPSAFTTANVRHRRVPVNSVRASSSSPARKGPRNPSLNRQNGNRPMPRDNSKGSIITAIQRKEGLLQRDDSESSIITAIKVNNSEKSSKSSSLRSGMGSQGDGGKGEAMKPQENGEAVVASSKAMKPQENGEAVVGSSKAMRSQENGEEVVASSKAMKPQENGEAVVASSKAMRSQENGEEVVASSKAISVRGMEGRGGGARKSETLSIERKSSKSLEMKRSPTRRTTNGVGAEVILDGSGGTYLGKQDIEMGPWKWTEYYEITTSVETT